MVVKTCEFCKNIFNVYNYRKNTAKYCSRLCHNRAIAKSRLGINHFNWLGGRSKCIDCNKIIKYHSIRCKGCFNKIKNLPKYCVDCSKQLSNKNSDIIRCRSCYILYNRKNNHPCWKGGLITRTSKYRSGLENAEWRNYIFRRDNYTCALCNNYGSVLNCHHIRKYSKYKHLRICRKNGITLCEKCHKKYVNHHEEDYEDYFDILILGKE